MPRICGAFQRVKKASQNLLREEQKELKSWIYDTSATLKIEMDSEG